MTAGWRGEGAQHQGARPYQEDSWTLRELADGGLLAVVADGMGGHAGGAVASKAAVAAFLKAVAEQGKDLAEGLAAANDAVRAAGAAKPGLAGLGTTLVGAIVRGNEVRWISVGDSPFYLAQGGTLCRLNADHSMWPQIEALVERGVISSEDAAYHPARHTLREAVMGEPLSLIDQGKLELSADAVLLLCSDGVQTLAEPDLLAKARRPVKGIVDAVLAAKRKHQDNITVVMLEREA